MTIEEIKTVTTTFAFYLLHSLKAFFLNTQFTNKDSEEACLVVRINEKTYKLENIQNAIVAIFVLFGIIGLSIAYHSYSILMLITSVWIFL